MERRPLPRVTRRSGWVLWFPVVLVWLSVSGAAGQTQDITELSPEELLKVRVYTASMYVQNDREAPSSVTIITAEQIRNFGYRTLADILRSAKGFYVSYDRNYSYVGVRGFARPGDYNDRILLLLNGHRLNDNVYDGAAIGTEFPLDVDLIDRVEIVRGPSSSLYGTSAFFAVVNVITKSAPSLSGLELSGEVDGFGTYKGRSTYGVNRGVEMLFSGTVYESAGPARLFFPAFDTPSTNYGIAQHADDDASRNIFGNISFHHFKLEALGSTREKGIPTASFGTVFNDRRTRTVDSSGFLDLQYSHPFSHDGEFNTRVSFDCYEYHGVYVYAPSTAGGPDVLNQDLVRGDSFGVKSYVTKPLWQKKKATVGVSFRDNLRQDQSNYNPVPFFLYLDDKRGSKEWALFGQDEFTVAKGLILNAGLRHDHYESFGGTTNPRLALIYSPLRKTTFKLIYGRAFRAPNNYELYYHDGISQESNPYLLPEKIQTTEFVWEQDLGAAFRLSAAGFQNRITDLINEEEDRKNGLIFYGNTEKVRSRGIELGLAGKTRYAIEGQISYTFQRTDDSATHQLLTNSPQQLAKMNVACPLLHRNLSLGGELQYVDLREAEPGLSVKGYTLFNLTISSREFAGGFRLSGSVYNLFNRKYSDPVGGEIVEPVLQQNGRDFRVKITRTFRFR